MRTRWASHEDTDRYPSRRYEPRRWISASLRARSTSSRSAARSSSPKFGFELVVACEAQVLGLELIERRTERAHATYAIEHAFDSKPGHCAAGFRSSLPPQVGHEVRHPPYSIPQKDYGRGTG